LIVLINILLLCFSIHCES